MSAFSTDLRDSRRVAPARDTTADTRRDEIDAPTRFALALFAGLAMCTPLWIIGAIVWWAL